MRFVCACWRWQHCCRWNRRPTSYDAAKPPFQFTANQHESARHLLVAGTCRYNDYHHCHHFQVQTSGACITCVNCRLPYLFVLKLWWDVISKGDYAAFHVQRKTPTTIRRVTYVPDSCVITSMSVLLIVRPKCTLAAHIPLLPGFLSFLCSLTRCLAPAPLKSRSNIAIQICLLLLLLLLLLT